jgi:hypothetical protein
MASWRFSDPGHETVERIEDGATFRWPPGMAISNVHVSEPRSGKDFPPPIRIVEAFCRDDGPRRIQPYRLKVEGRALAVLAAVLGEDGGKQAIEALHGARLQIVETPRPCR